MKVQIPREETYRDVQHPDFLFGRSIIRPNLHELADRIKNGWAPDGWEGDPRLALAYYRDPATRQEWHELWRLENDGEYRLVAKLPGHLDPSNITRKLVEMDARRGYDVKAAVDRHNAKLQAKLDAVEDDRHSAAAEKLAWALRRDLGHTVSGTTRENLLARK